MGRYSLVLLMSLYSVFGPAIPGEEQLPISCLSIPYAYNGEHLDGYPITVIDPVNELQWECRYIAPTAI